MTASPSAEAAPAQPSANRSAAEGAPSGRKRYLLVGDLPPPANGQSVAFETLCRGLPGRGFDCHVVDLARRSATPRGRMSLSRSFEIGACLARFAAGLLRGCRRVYLLAAQSRAGFWRDMAMIWCAWACGCRIVAHLHGGNYDGFYRAQPALLRFLIRHTLRRVGRLITLSERLRPMFDFDAALARRLAVVPNCLGQPPEGRPRRERHPSAPLRLLFLSNLMQSKGYRDVLEALVILKTRRLPSPKAIFAGIFQDSADDVRSMSAHEAEQEFNDYVSRNGLADTVRYVGAVAGREKWRLLEASDVLLLPTSYAFEGQPISIIEAMAHGCVVVATNYRAIPDLVVDGETGVLVEYGRPDQLASAIEALSADADRFGAMSKAAVERYRERFTLDRHLDAMAEVLESV